MSKNQERAILRNSSYLKSTAFLFKLIQVCYFLGEFPSPQRPGPRSWERWGYIPLLRQHFETGSLQTASPTAEHRDSRSDYNYGWFKPLEHQFFEFKSDQCKCGIPNKFFIWFLIWHRWLPLEEIVESVFQPKLQEKCKSHCRSRFWNNCVSVQDLSF